MDSRREAWVPWIIVSALAGALVPGCGIDAPPPETTGPEQLLAPAVACMTVEAGGAWSNQPFPDQTRRFHVEFDATPSTSAIDAVVGLSAGSASSFSQLAAIVRFNAAGTIDVRSGSTYRSDVPWSYQAGTTYHLRIDVDPRTHAYSVSLRIGDLGGYYVALAGAYPFRAEQAGVTYLDNVASDVDSATGTLDVCGVTVVVDATTADGCVIATAGDGFVGVALPAASVLDTVGFTAQSSVQNIDAVIGLSSGAAARFSDLAAAVRFSPAGVLDVRDGNSYRADVAIPYGLTSLNFRMIADLTSHTYSVFQGTPQLAQELARQYGFRTEQRTATLLDHLDVIVDGAQGSVTVCAIQGSPSSGVAYSREGNYAVLPLGNDEVLLSDGATTTRVSATGAVLAGVARGGELASDVLGNVFIASITDNTLTVDKYTAGFTPRWTATGTVLAGATINAIAADPSGAVLIGVVTPQDGTVTVFRFTAGGAFASLFSTSGSAIALDGDRPVIAWNDRGTLRITRYAPGGATLWTRGFVGAARITAITVDPNHNVVFGGDLTTAIDFGGGTLLLSSNPDGGAQNAFFVKLSSTGDHVFSRKTGYWAVGGIAANASRIVVSGTERTQFFYEHLQWFDAAGGPGGGAGAWDGFGGEEHGFGGRVSLGPSGRVWWNVQTQWPLFPIWRYLVVFTG